MNYRPTHVHREDNTPGAIMMERHHANETT
jgi:hypothetical protein